MSYIPDAISVVIPTYNRAHLIKASIQSVLDQTLQPYEIIVVDDFSTDNTEEVVNSFNSPLIKYVKNQRKKGANGARNTGILMAKGEFIAFHDSDDIWLPKKLMKQHNILVESSNIEMCFTTISIEISNGTIETPSRKMQSFEISEYLDYKNFISTQTIFMKTKKAASYLFDENIKRFQDWDFVLRLKKTTEIYHLSDILVLQKKTQNSISYSENTLKAYQAIYEKYNYLINKGPYNRYISYKIRCKYLDNRKKNILILIYYRILVFIFTLKHDL